MGTPKYYNKFPAEDNPLPGSKGVKKRVLISKKDGAPTFTMRLFEIQPGGFTPKHKHGFEHEVFVKTGSGTYIEGDKPHPFREGDVIFVPPNVSHQFKNTGGKKIELLCIVPNEGAI